MSGNDGNILRKRNKKEENVRKCWKYDEKKRYFKNMLENVGNKMRKLLGLLGESNPKGEQKMEQVWKYCEKMNLKRRKCDTK